ncbi:class I SAM-dependent rRNA methyltransferase [Alteribacillus sp. JSM 102045]|uniref:class I SAM-dependent rRNA methyltransferase n=1 Tax=Alteribacillus sp. JSM 102045 TaxID=1562101 RepID=UPI0035C139BB
MTKEITLKLKNKFLNKYKKGYPLLWKEAISNVEVLKEEGTLLRLTDEYDRFLGKGYYGRQNKGYGWILTQNENESIDQKFFDNKISTAFNKRRSFFQDDETTAFRLFNGEGDGIGGLTIDNYDGYYVITWYSLGIFTFKDFILRSLQKVSTFRGIYQKKRFNTAGKYVEDDDFVTGERGEFPITVKENGVNVAVHLNEGPMTGIFLDQRNVRQAIRDQYAKGRRVLNTFSYTGAFSVFAALGGAENTTSVDLANRSLPKTREQFSVNNIDYEAHKIKVMDVFKYFNYAYKKGLTFDMVILDPPSFARSKKRTFSAAKDYKDLVKKAVQLTEDDGIIVASTNHSGFGMDKFKSFIKQAFKEAGKKYKLLEEHDLPKDFPSIEEYPEGNYLKVVFIKKFS